MEVITWMTSSVPFNKKDATYHCLIKLNENEKHTFELSEKVRYDFTVYRNKLELSADNYDKFIEEIKNKIDIIIRATFEL